MQQKTETQEVLEQVLAEDAARGFEPEVCDPVELGPLEENAVVGVVTEPLVFEEMTDRSSQLPTLPPPKLCGAKRGDGAPCTLEPHAGVLHSYAGAPFAAGRETATTCGCNCCATCGTDVLQILTNMGHDVTCGACMCRAFTGFDGGHEHMCKTPWIPISTPPDPFIDVLISAGDIVTVATWIRDDLFNAEGLEDIRAQAWQPLPAAYRGR